MKEATLSRRTFVGGIAAGVGGIGSTTTAAARGPPERPPSITFPDGNAFVGPDNPGPMEAAVETEDVHMPQGGWVVILRDEDPIGMSMRRLPAGRFKKLRVATRAQETGEFDLVAMLYKEEGVPYMTKQGPVFDTAAIRFP